MSSEQMTYFYNACLSVDANEVDLNSLAFSRVMTDKDGQRKVEQTIDQLRNSLIKNLIRK